MVDGGVWITPSSKYTCDLAMISITIQEFGILTWKQSTLMQRFHGQGYLSLVFLLDKLLVTFFLSMIRKDVGYETLSELS
jgi:hypothetical protein